MAMLIEYILYILSDITSVFNEFALNKRLMKVYDYGKI